MSPSEVEELLDQEPFHPLRITLASGDQIIVREEHHPIVSGLSLVLSSEAVAGRVTAGPRLVSIPNITLVDPFQGRPPTTRRRR